MKESFDLLARVKLQRILLAAMVVAIYGVSLANGFVWDDNIYFIGKSAYRDFDLLAIFGSLANGVEYLPLRDITYAVDHLLWGEKPFGFHLTNLLFFAGNVILVHRVAGLIVSRLATLASKPASRFIPFAVAAGFAVHPINAEAASFITCRNVLVSGVFFFLSFICIIRFFEETMSFSTKWYLASLGAFICAMLGKATAIMLPLLFIVTLPILFPGRLKRLLLFMAPFFLTAGGFYFCFKAIADKAGFTGVETAGLQTAGLEKTVAFALQIPVFYLKKLLLPYGFSAEYMAGFDVGLFSVKAVLSFAILVVIGASALLLRRRAPWYTLGVCWFIAGLLPVLNFFATHPLVADRYVFLPAFGFMLVTASTIDMIRQDKVKVSLCLVIGFLLAGVAGNRSLDWRTDETLWTANIRNFPNESKSYLNLAAFYFRNREQGGTALSPSGVTLPWLNVYLEYYEGKRLFNQNDLAGAKQRFQKSVDVVTDFISALYFLGAIAEKEGDFVAAVQYYNRALAIDDYDTFHEFPVMRERLQALKTGWLDQYLAAAKLRLEKNPADLAARRELALTLDRLCYYREALEQYLLLEKEGIKGWQIYHNIANCYFNMSKAGDAIRFYEKALALGGGSDETLNNLGISYKKLAKYDKSIEVLRSAISRYPAAPYPAFNLGVTYFEAGQKENSRLSFTEVERKFPAFKERTAPYMAQLTPATK